MYVDPVRRHAHTSAILCTCMYVCNICKCSASAAEKENGMTYFIHGLMTFIYKLKYMIWMLI